MSYFEKALKTFQSRAYPFNECEQKQDLIIA